MDKREPINIKGSMMDLLLLMGEGNPGAISVLADLMNNYSQSGIFMILDLDDMNIRGPQIWVAYKDHCGAVLDRFAECVVDRDPAMIKTVNTNMGPEYPHRAGQHGVGPSSAQVSFP